MNSVHLSKELLDAVAAERLEPDVLQEMLLLHLAEGCPTCEEAVSSWAGWRRLRGTPRGAAGLVQALRLLLERVPDAGRKAIEAERLAREDLETLRPLPHPERQQRIGRGLGRFRGPELAALCLEEARRSLPAHPGRAREWAVAAEQAALRTRDPAALDRAEALLALAIAHQGNALRALERFPAAEERFGRAEEMVRLGVVHDLSDLAEIHCLEASLHRDLRRFDASERCLLQGALLYRVARDRPREASSLVTLSTLYQAQGWSARALETAERAEEALPEAADPRLLLAVRHNRARFLCELGRHVDAAEALEDARPLYALFDDAWTQLRLAWLEGTIARGRGEVERAEERLRTAREGFLAEESAYDAALVSLELAGLYLDQGRTAAVRRLAEEMVGTFRFLGVRREALAAAALFAEAAERERVTAGLVARLALYLRQSQGPGPLPAFETRC